MIKLLTRLYEPTRGRILFRGVDLRYFEAAELHRRIGSIFQDFVHYQLTLKENIGFGQVEKIEDPERVAKAAGLSGADEIAAAILFLSSHEAGWITGETLVIDGGRQLTCAR